MTIAWGILILSVGCLGAVFVLYPLILLILSPFARKDALNYPISWPEVCVVIAARNAESLTRQKIRNTLEQDYPQDKLSVIFISDGSTDATARIAEESKDDRVTVIDVHEHRGKIYALNLAARQAKADILVFSDVDATLSPNSIASLVSRMSSPDIGGVCGKRILMDDPAKLTLAQERYIQLDTIIKQLESHWGCLSSNDGKLYAIRRDLFRPIPEAVTDDLFIALGIIESGYKFVFEPHAQAAVPTPSRSPRHELRRRRRIVGQSLRGVFLRKHLLSPRQYGLFALALFINKVLRRLMPFFLITLFLSSLILVRESFAVAVLFACQTACYLMAALWLPLGILPALPHPLARISQTCFYVVIGNLGMLFGVLDFLRGKSVARWEPEKGTPRPVHNPTATTRPYAYVMSRFPKITETFILYEMLELIKRDINVRIYPLIKHTEAVSHPEVETVKPLVQQMSFFSGAIIAANISMLLSSPIRYIKTLTKALTETWGNTNHFIRTIVLFPKCVWMAQDMRKHHTRHIHAHFATHPATAAFIIHELTGIPYSITAHAHDIQITTQMLRTKFSSASFAVTISDYNKELLRSIVGDGVASKIHVLHCGVDTSFFKPPQSHRERSRISILCVASYKDMKGHKFLIEACKILKERGLSFTCHLVGDGPLREAIAERIRNAKLQNDVMMYGPLSRPVVREMQREMDIAVLPSVKGARGDMEGIPVSLMEAMACSLPVVSTRLSGIPELVQDGETGFLVPPEDAAALADALQRLASDASLRQRMGEAGRKVVERDYDIRKNTASLAELLLSHTDNSPKGVP